MNTLIFKLGATGDVVRTTSLLRKLDGHVTWITEEKNTCLVEGLHERIRCLSWQDRKTCLDKKYDLLINLEDSVEVGFFARDVEYEQLFGSYVNSDDSIRYTDDSKEWFDLSLISKYGRKKADELKYQNRKTYQELIFDGLGWRFSGEKYSLPKATETGLKGDVAISPIAGAVWPMKAWAHYEELQKRLEAEGYTVNTLRTRPTLLEHLADVQGHTCLVSGDSLPMHLALGSGVKCVSIFNCTSPWEIYDYDLLTKLVSPLLKRHFYQRDFDTAATTAVSLDEVSDAVFGKLKQK